MADTKKIVTGYFPRKLQEFLHANLKRFSVLVCHRRFGKTVFAVNQMLHRALRCPLKYPQYAYLSPTYKQSKQVAWEMLKQFTSKIPGATANEADLRVDIPRPNMGDHVRLLLLGAENPDSLRGLYLDGTILDEYSQCPPDVFSKVIRPALSDRKGWGIFIGTPSGQNHFYDIYQIAKENASGNWFHAMYKASETGIVDEEELRDARATMSEEEYNQEYECDFAAAMVGAYFGKHLNRADEEGRITDVPYDPNYPVVTAWDLGMDDETAIWCMQMVGREPRVINYYKNDGKDLRHYWEWLKGTRYTFAHHLLPHDVSVRELGTGKTRMLTLQNHGMRDIQVLPKRQHLMDWIHAGRLLIDKAYFDRTKCADGLNSLRNYERKYDTKKKKFDDRPLHNWASHGADAFQHLAYGHREDYTDTQQSHLPRQCNMAYDIFDYENDDGRSLDGFRRASRKF